MSKECTGGSSWSVPKTRLFISYSHEDKAYRDQIVAHLASLVRAGMISSWEDRKITPGQDWSEAINENLAQADIIVVLASADFLASDYCSGVELQQALARHSSGRSVLVPILVRPCALSASPLAKLEALPEKAQPVSEWENRDRAWTNVVEGLLRVVPLIEARKKVFLEKFVPPILIKAYARRAHLIDLELDVEFRPDGMYVHPRAESVKCETIVRNIQRLSSRQPEIRQRLEAFYNRLGESLARAQKEVWQLYGTLFVWRGPLELALNAMLQNPLETLSGLLNEELEINDRLSKAELSGSLFGLPPVGDAVMDSMAALKAMTENMSELTKGMKQFSHLVKEVEEIGKRGASGEFEEPEKGSPQAEQKRPPEDRTRRQRVQEPPPGEKEDRQGTGSAQKPVTTEQVKPSPDFFPRYEPGKDAYDRACDFALKADWTRAFEELKAAAKERHPEALRMLSTAWCPRCSKRVPEPSPDSIADFAQFWRGRCPRCQGHLQFRKQ